jgi:hypothetical protein
MLLNSFPRIKLHVFLHEIIVSTLNDRCTFGHSRKNVDSINVVPSLATNDERLRIKTLHIFA